MIYPKGGYNYYRGAEMPSGDKGILPQNFEIDKETRPWECGDKLIPRGLVNLMEILQFYAGTFLTLMATIDIIKGTIQHVNRFPVEEKPQALKDNKERLAKTFKTIQRECEELELDGSVRLIKILLVNMGHINIEELTMGIDTLQDMVISEMNDRSYLRIPQIRIGWFDKEDAFGPKVSKVFSKAIPDIKDAGNCYAIGLHTACVFHLMRVLEHGLGALAKDVGLKFYRQSWGGIIGKIQNKIDNEIEALNKMPKDPARTERLTFVSKAAKEFVYFKDGWRNYAMHSLEEYDAPKAESVLNHVKAFMIHLSSRLTE